MLSLNGKGTTKRGVRNLDSGFSVSVEPRTGVLGEIEVLGIKPRYSFILGKSNPIELPPQPKDKNNVSS